MEQEILNYIKDAHGHGLSDHDIKQNLLDVGWDLEQVEESFAFTRAPGSVGEGLISSPETTTSAKAAPLSGNASNNTSSSAKPGLGAMQHSAVLQPQTRASQKPTMPNQLTEAPATNISLAKITSTPTIDLSDTHFEAQKAKSKTPLVIGVSFVVLALLGAGGYFAYGYYFPRPQTVWTNYQTATKNPIYTSSFNINYSDPGIPDQDGSYQKLNLGLTGSAYINSKDPSATETKTDLVFSYKLENTPAQKGQSGSRKISAVFLDNSLYLDLSDIPELGQMFNPPQNLSWIKIDLNTLRALASTTPYYTADVQNQEKQFNDKARSDFAAILKATPVASMQKVIGPDTINGVSVYHFQNQIDKTVIKKLINSAIDDAVASSTLAQALEIGAGKQIVNNFIDKINIIKYETWIGRKDSQLYKISLDIQFPGAVSMLAATGNPLGIARAKARDAKRLADLRQLSSALELYFNDHNGYPPSLNGVPQQLSPTYIGEVPKAPEPNDGDCSDYYNSYWYTPKGTSKNINGLIVYPDYEYSFCLGDKTGSYKGGLAKMTPQGISAGLPCQDSAQNCQSQKAFWPPPGADTPAELKIDISYSDYGKKQTLAAPNNAWDLVKYIESQMLPQPPIMPLPHQSQPLVSNNNTTNKSNDQLRENDINSMIVELEQYYTDKSDYPENLNQLIPKYLPAIPTAPLPPEGTCSTQDNQYEYQRVSASSYKLSFCLGKGTSHLSPGKHIWVTDGQGGNYQ